MSSGRVAIAGEDVDPTIRQRVNKAGEMWFGNDLHHGGRRESQVGTNSQPLDVDDPRDPLGAPSKGRGGGPQEAGWY